MTKCVDNNYMLNSNRYFNNMYSMNNANSALMNMNNNNCCANANTNNNNCCPNMSGNLMTTNNCCSAVNNNSDNCHNERAEMLKEIMSLDFALTELQLYLNTHPDDEKALCLYKKYAKELKELKEAYQKVYGPLTKEFPCNKWRWLEEPWPWEGGIV